MLRKTFPLILVFVCVAAIAMAASTTGPSYQKLTLSIPSGDVEAGRVVFMDMKCYSCHSVGGDEAKKVPARVSSVSAPLLDHRLAEKDLGEVATSIVAPSHKVSSVIAELSGGKLSPMGDFSQVMTVRELADLLAYLRSFEEAKPVKKTR